MTLHCSSVQDTIKRDATALDREFDMDSPG